MIPVNGKIMVRCNLKQKDTMKVGGIIMSCAQKFKTNYREKSPVICEVVQGNRLLKPGTVILAHHNTFYTPSPFHVQDDLFSIPFAKTLFAIVEKDGHLKPICGNILCDRVDVPTPLPVPPEHRKQYIDRVVVTDGYGTKYKKGQLLFTRPHSYYEIVFMYNDVETKVHKCHSDMVVGYVK